MINPKILNLSELPSLTIKNRALLPNTAGIYFAIDSQGTIQYIGRSSNINQRWKAHHRQSSLEKCDRVRIVWLEISDCDLLPSVETSLIEWFQPCLNFQTCLKEDEEKMVRTSVTIPESVIEKFKIYCRDKRRSVSAQITFLIEQELEQQKEDKKND